MERNFILHQNDPHIAFDPASHYQSGGKTHLLRFLSLVARGIHHPEHHPLPDDKGMGGSFRHLYHPDDLGSDNFLHHRYQLLHYLSRRLAAFCYDFFLHWDGL